LDKKEAGGGKGTKDPKDKRGKGEEDKERKIGRVTLSQVALGHENGCRAQPGLLGPTQAQFGNEAY
jgi:hypothetical protein